MSRFYSATITFIFLVAIGFAAREAEVDTPDIGGRSPSSLSKKEMILGELRPREAVLHTEKLHGPLQAKLEPVGSSAAMGQVFVLRAQVSTTQDLAKVEYEWSIPEGVEVVNGAVTGALDELPAAQPAQVEITLKKLVADNRQIHFNAKSHQAEGFGFSDTAQFNTELQDVIKARNLAAKKSSQPAKVFH